MHQQSKLVLQSRAVAMAADSDKMRAAIRGLAKSGVSQVREADKTSLGSLKANDTPTQVKQANDNQQMRQPGNEQSQGRGR